MLDTAAVDTAAADTAAAVTAAADIAAVADTAASIKHQRIHNPLMVHPASDSRQNMCDIYSPTTKKKNEIKLLCINDLKTKLMNNL